MNCYKCQQDTWVSVRRVDTNHPAWGCTNCGSAVEESFKCADCKDNFTAVIDREAPVSVNRCSKCEELRYKKLAKEWSNADIVTKQVNA
jgi:DNA-directed RNA polymerase subunit RPC12/RpoP